MTIPRLVIAGATSGVGKTTLTSGLIASLRNRGLRVQPFKCGPDYVDPSYHSLAAGIPCRNLDGWMVPWPAVLELFERSCRSPEGNIDLALIEGVMGLYDGRTGQDEAGSTAEVAKKLDAPVVLILDVKATARSAGAMALGYKFFDPSVKLAGFILNRVGSPTHLRWTKEAIESATGLPVLGHLPKNADIYLPERHLGLLPSGENGEALERVERICHQIEETVDVSALAKIATSAAPIVFAKEASDRANLFPTQDLPERIRLAVALDEAFSFYYQDNFDLLRAWGAKILPVSPLSNAVLPEEVDGFYVGGGFPEMYAADLAGNVSFRASVLRAARDGMPIYGECGGLMYLAEGITDFEGRRHDMVGAIPGWSAMQGQRARMGYVTVEAQADSIIARQGHVLRGHEFHWSQREEPTRQAAYLFADSNRQEGYVAGNLLASYIHLHFGSDISLLKRFISSCEAWRARN